ncbi:MAG: hypothetical protein RL037_344 [Bacteroidota bacterium]
MRLIMPGFGSEIPMVLSDSMYSSSTNFLPGYSFGGMIRRDFERGFSIEGGINYTQRHLKVSMAVADSGISLQNNITFVNYEFPIQGLVFVKLTKSIFGSAGLGTSFFYKPTSVRVNNYTDGKSNFVHYGYSRWKFGAEINAQAGFEFRTKKSGYFYLGTTAKIALAPLFEYNGLYFYGTQLKANDFRQASGAFLSVDLRYYFPKIRNSGKQPLLNPIE